MAAEPAQPGTIRHATAPYNNSKKKHAPPKRRVLFGGVSMRVRRALMSLGALSMSGGRMDLRIVMLGGLMGVSRFAVMVRR